ncbi:MAG: MBL fold metallo-hydrolase [Clostridium chrysemydis]|uniref:MBL fold metallo-hydrolase n=1 Tax=Clostridium TaxID=1485 RepID=UPI0021520585|nr:MBL fold metallo-hydrolase [Clostridium sp. LY3-2]MCR6513393.1 MBL fold metallo-hydrolase [Clostridium sp. LY3-2]
MLVKVIPTGTIEENCYLVMDENTKEGFIVDPGDEPLKIEKAIKDTGMNLKYILLTHAHFDHVGALNYLVEKFNVPFYMNKEEEEFAKTDNYVFGKINKANGYLDDNSELSIGNESIRVFHTPGHTVGGLCFLIGNKLFTGDTLFRSSVGRSDFPGGDMTALVNSIKTKLLPLGDEIEVYPGHGPMSTIGYEKKNNMFLY